MADYSKLIAKLENKADEIDKLESIFMRLTISRVSNLEKAERISANIVTLMSKAEGLSKKLDLQSLLDFAFKEEKDLIYSIVADVFDISVDDVALVPISCIYECIIKDKIARSFLPRLAVLDARAQSDTLPKAAPFQTSKPTPSTLSPKASRK